MSAEFFWIVCEKCQCWKPTFSHLILFWKPRGKQITNQAWVFYWHKLHLSCIRNLTMHLIKLYFLKMIICLSFLRIWILKGGYAGFYSKNTVTLTRKTVDDIHKKGGTILGTSRGGHDTIKIVDSIQDRGINMVKKLSFFFNILW